MLKLVSDLKNTLKYPTNAGPAAVSKQDYKKHFDMRLGMDISYKETEIIPSLSQEESRLPTDRGENAT